MENRDASHACKWIAVTFPLYYSVALLRQEGVNLKRIQSRPQESGNSALYMLLCKMARQLPSSSQIVTTFPK